MVYVLLAPGFEESEAVVPTDLLRQAGLETALVSLSGPTVSGSHRRQRRPPDPGHGSGLVRSGAVPGGPVQR